MSTVQSPTDEAPPDGVQGRTPHENWWSRQVGGAEVLRVAAPLVVSSLSWTVMTFIDRMMLNHWSGTAMTAAFIGSVAWFALVCLPLGVCMYTSTFVAQYYGSSQPHKIGPSVWQGTWLALAASPLTLAAIPLAPFLFSLAGHDSELTDLETRYFEILCWGAPAMLFAQSLSSFYSGRGKTVIVMIVDALFAALNVLLDYLWIFGHAGFPAMGIEGAAWATVVALWLKALVYLLLFVAPINQERFSTSLRGVDYLLLRRMLYFGWPSGLQILLDVVGFQIFIVLVARLGAVEHEATSMAFSVSMLAFMPVHGLSMAASILVGQHLGENRDRIAAQSTWTSLHVALAYMTLISMLYTFVPNLFLYGFDSGEHAEHGPLVLATAATLLRYVAIYNFFDAALMVFVSAIKGAGDTRFVLWVSLAMAILLGSLSYLAVEVFNLGLYACWALITAWVCSLGLIYLARFIQGKWRKMRVIETPIEPETVAA